MPNTKFHCGDIVKVSNLTRYCSEIQQEYVGKEIPIVCIHPVTTRGTVDFTAPDIQYIVPSVNPTSMLAYVAFVSSDLEKVGHIEYRSIFGTFKCSDLLTMLNSPKNPVEEYMFKQCLQTFQQFMTKNKVSYATYVKVSNKVKGSEDYFSGMHGVIHIEVVKKGN